MTDKLIEQIKTEKQEGPVENEVATVMSWYLNTMEDRILADAEVIKALETENARLRYALRAIGNLETWPDNLMSDKDIARAALGGNTDDE